MLNRTALEAGFPASVINAAAEQESWRKEVHRPATHTHKWWAQRLGTVFRGLLVSAFTDSQATAAEAFGSPYRASGTLVFDPFAGSGTTLVEAIKLGCKVVGQDINPVATLVQRQALAAWDRPKLDAAFEVVSKQVKDEINELHKAASGETVLYYFWVSQASCRRCPVDAPAVDLFSSYIFSKNAYPSKKPLAQALCRHCGDVVVVNCITDDSLTCSRCGETSSLDGPVQGANMTCPAGHETKIIAALNGKPPARRMYAKMVLGFNSKKRYEPVDDFDLALYKKSSARLIHNEAMLVLPIGRLDRATIPSRQ